MAQAVSIPAATITHTLGTFAGKSSTNYLTFDPLITIPGLPGNWHFLAIFKNSVDGREGELFERNTSPNADDVRTINNKILRITIAGSHWDATFRVVGTRERFDLTLQNHSSLYGAIRNAATRGLTLQYDPGGSGTGTDGNGDMAPAGLAPTATLASKGRRKRNMFLGNTRRDVEFVTMRQGLNAFSTSAANDEALTANMRSSGLVQDKVLILNFGSDESVPSGKKKLSGGYLTGPDDIVEETDVRTLYRIVGEVVSRGHDLEFVCGVSASSVKASAAGDAVVYLRTLAGSIGGVLSLDMCLAMEAFGTISGTSLVARALAFGVAIVNSSGSARTSGVRGVISLQRLVGAPPAILDRRLN